ADLSGLEITDSLHISRIELPEGVEPVISDRDFTIATIAAPAGVKEELRAAAEAAAAAKTAAETAAAEGAPAEGAPAGEGAAPAGGAAAGAKPAAAAKKQEGLARSCGAEIAMLLIVGLGNPGSQYARNRHNVGFIAVDAIHRRHGFSPWRRRFQGEVAEGTLSGEKILLLKPQTYMNESGRSVQAAAAFYKI